MPEASQRRRAWAAVRAHWPEYALEALQLGLFMVSASAFSVLLFHPGSPAAGSIESPLLRRGLMGLAMGLTAVALIYSPMGQRSGAHMNPSITLAYWRLGKVGCADAVFYILAQFIGGAAGMLAMHALLGRHLADPAIRHVATVPGAAGAVVAWVGEFIIAFVLMLAVLISSNRKSIAPFTGLLAGCLVALFIFVESPLSGTSMNPARTLGSSIAGQLWTGLWIYFTAPTAAMLLAAEAYLRFNRHAMVYCAKLNHFNARRCIFRCRFHDMVEGGAPELGIAARPAAAAARPTLPQETLHFG